jgi:hypothetical protein
VAALPTLPLESEGTVRAHGSSIDRSRSHRNHLLRLPSYRLKAINENPHPQTHGTCTSNTTRLNVSSAEAVGRIASHRLALHALHTFCSRLGCPSNGLTQAHRGTPPSHTSALYKMKSSNMASLDKTTVTSKWHGLPAHGCHHGHAMIRSGFVSG